MQITMKDRLQGSLLGVRIGDALGMPVETMEPMAILDATNMQGITGFVDAIQKRLKEQSEFKAGDATDDWQLTRVVAESLIACQGYNQEDMARRHVQAMQQTQAGWGGTTRRSVKELKEYFASGGTQGRSPQTLPTPRPESGAGNGIAMKVASIPFAVHLAERDPEGERIWGTHTTFTWVDQLAALTHCHADAMYTAYAVASAIAHCLYHPVQTIADSKLLLASVIVDLDFIRGKSRFYKHTVAGGHLQVIDPGDTIAQLRKLLPIIGLPERIRQELPPTYTAIDSVPYALGVFLSFPTDARKALLTCVNAGLDTDTTAAICGSLLGANGGVSVFPEEWRRFRSDFWEVLNLGEKLYETFSTLVLPKHPHAI